MRKTFTGTMGSFETTEGEGEHPPSMKEAFRVALPGKVDRKF